MNQTKQQPQNGDSIYYLKLLAAFSLMLGTRFIPAPAPITQAGMAVIGMFLGLIVLIALVDVTWPVFALLCIITFFMPQIYGEAAQNSPLSEAVVKSFGNWIVLFMVGTFLLSDAMDQWGLIKRITLWFVTRNISKKGPWHLTVMLLLSAFVLGLFMDCTAATIVVLLCAHEVFRTLDFREGDEWPRMVVAAVPFTITAAYAATPIGHPSILTVMSMIASATGTELNLLSYMMVGIPLALLFFVAMIFYLQRVVRPDLSRFVDLDYNKLEEMKTGRRMGIQETIVSAVVLAVLVLWLLPGFLAIVANGSWAHTLLNRLSMLYPTLLGCLILAVIRIDGQPILNMKAALNRIAWTPVFMFAGILFISNAMQQPACGLLDWFEQTVSPVVSGFSPYWVITLIAILTVISTNIMNNTAIAVLYTSAFVPVIIGLGINPLMLALATAFASNLAFTTPAASVIAGLSCSDPYCNPAFVFRHGLVMTAFGILTVCLVYPLTAVLF